MAQGYVWRNGSWQAITSVGEHTSGSWTGNDGYVWHNGQWVTFTDTTLGLIEGFEDISDSSEVLRGTFTGSTTITSDAALATHRGSTQGMRCEGFVEHYALPQDYSPAILKGYECGFHFKPISFDSNDQWHFILAPQPDKAEPPDWCYRFEFHMDGGSRITRIDGQGSRTILATENEMNWKPELYHCHFQADSSGVSMRISNTVVSLSTSDTTYVADEMGFGFRASGGGIVDYDWLTYE